MIIKLISDTNVDSFNKKVEELITQMENDNNVLVDTKYKPLKHPLESKIAYTVLLFFVSPYKEQSKMSSIMGTGLAVPKNKFMK